MKRFVIFVAIALLLTACSTAEKLTQCGEKAVVTDIRWSEPKVGKEAQSTEYDIFTVRDSMTHTVNKGPRDLIFVGDTVSFCRETGEFHREPQ